MRRLPDFEALRVEARERLATNWIPEPGPGLVGLIGALLEHKYRAPEMSGEQLATAHLPTDAAELFALLVDTPRLGERGVRGLVPRPDQAPGEPVTISAQNLAYSRLWELVCEIVGDWDDDQELR